ncbi:hypothetical protein [Streptomonospora litoralis]|uniref:Uncharacterized protein n=1 Tax=Streptomonospora litoralis TaxID=2498135 RepID=A0A4P6Q323_9ACTN|nr:hypothetical protein [Streptomonospora litoralis]QBI54985.1 hypothetical protein EKD16_16065 [Streptomonospora litoralis]
MESRGGAKGGVRRLGLPWWGIVGLAALGAPRAIAHDLDLVGPALNSVLVFAPVVVWIAAVVLMRVPRPLLALLAVGAVYGVLLGGVHQLLWAQSFAGEPPALGGNLAGALPPAVESGVLRAAAFLSSVVTGVLVGAASGAAAWLLSRALPARAQ